MPTEVQTCYRHDDRRAGVICQRCDRPICPECMHQASVGFHCPECVKGGRQTVVTARQLRQGPSASSVPITTALIAINVAVYLLASAGAGMAGPSGSFELDYALIGRGATNLGLIGVGEGEWFRLITGGFLHASLLHLGFNMYVLWMLGRQLEPVLGRVTFAAVYGASLLAGSLGVMVVDPNALTVGASGAVFGLFGYLVVFQLNRGINPMDTGLGGIIIINLLFTFLAPGVSIGGHLGGLVGGAVAGLLHVGVQRQPSVPRGFAPAAITVFGLACAAVSIVVAGA